MRRPSAAAPGSACLPRGSTAGHNAISLTEASTLGYDLGHLFMADLFDRLRYLPLIAIGVEKHEDPVPVELLDRFQEDFETGFLDSLVDRLEIGHQQGQRDPKAVRTFANPSGPNLMFVMKFIQSPQQQSA